MLDNQKIKKDYSHYVSAILSDMVDNFKNLNKDIKNLPKGNTEFQDSQDSQDLQDLHNIYDPAFEVYKNAIEVLSGLPKDKGTDYTTYPVIKKIIRDYKKIFYKFILLKKN